MKKQLQPNNDIEFIKNPEIWPKWPLCPMKRHKNKYGKIVPQSPECGFIMASRKHLTIIFLESIWSMGGRNLSSIIEDTNIKRIEYKSQEELLANGWVVD